MSSDEFPGSWKNLESYGKINDSGKSWKSVDLILKSPKLCRVMEIDHWCEMCVFELTVGMVF